MSSSTDWPDGVGRIVLPRVDSTMAEASRRLPDLNLPTWVMAAEQTDGRGRHGRMWAMPPGNFAATLAMAPRPLPEGDGPAEAALRSFVAALALFDALSTVTGRTDPYTLKWPNDVLLHGGKVAGILLENTPKALLVGVGVNLAAAPDPADLEADAVAPVAVTPETGAEVRPATFLDALAPAFAAWDDMLVAEGFAPIRSAWLARASHVGKPIRARTRREEFTGTFDTIDAAGHLVLTTPTARHTIAAADVFF